MMLDATQRYDQPLSADRLFSWHAARFPTGRSGLHRITVGEWRVDGAVPMQVVSGPVGRQRVHFEAPGLREMPINARQRLAINLLLEGFEGKLTTSKWAALTKTSQDTALRDIHELLERGVLVRDAAGGRSTSYSLIK